MGNRRHRRASKRLQETNTILKSTLNEWDSPEKCGNGKRYKDSCLIDPETYVALSNEMLRTPPPDRKVFITMKDYALKTITANYRCSPHAPTNLIVFSMRLIRQNIFQPILVVQRYDSEDQSYVIAQCLKAIILDIASLSLDVLATISPPSDLFRKVLAHLVNIPDFENHNNHISYSSEPFREILHLYDIDTILSSFQELFYSHKEMCFFAENQLKHPKWEDVQYVLESNRINCIYTNAEGKDYNIFTYKFQMNMARALNSGSGIQRLSKSTDILVNLVFSFANIRDIERKSIHILASIYADLEDLRLALVSMHFRKLDKPSKKVTISQPKNSSSKVSSGPISSSIEIAKAEMDIIIDTIDKSIEKDEISIHKKSLAQLVKDHLSEREKIILKKLHNVDLNELGECPKNVSSETNLSSFSDEFDFEVNDVTQFFGAIVNFENENVVEPRKIKKSRRKSTEHATNPKADNTRDNFMTKKISSKSKLDKTVDNDDLVYLNDCDSSVDAQDYINFLRQSCDNGNQNHLNDFELKSKIYADVSDVLEENYVTNRLTNDWLSTIKALPELEAKLHSRRVKEFLPMSLTLVHSDYFVNVMKSKRSGFLKTTFNPPGNMRMLDYNAALSMLTNALYLIKKN